MATEIRSALLPSRCLHSQTMHAGVFVLEKNVLVYVPRIHGVFFVIK
jgi:hypothetical protein